MTLIGHRCKCCKILSRVILIIRVASSLTNSLSAKLNFKALVLTGIDDLNYEINSLYRIPSQASSPRIVVVLARRSHLFPSRTQQLSFSAPMVLGL
jgi:hypothetical protein